jgi:hypothetical protein
MPKACIEKISKQIFELDQIQFFFKLEGSSLNFQNCGTQKHYQDLHT